jgi:hypothetical protein
MTLRLPNRHPAGTALGHSTNTLTLTGQRCTAACGLYSALLGSTRQKKLIARTPASASQQNFVLLATHHSFLPLAKTVTKLS